LAFLGSNLLIGVLPAMMNHKKWLDGFKQEIEHAKIIENEVTVSEELKKIRIKQKADETRKMIREGGQFPQAIFKSKIEKRTRPLSPSTNFKMKIGQENRKLIQSMALEPGFSSHIENGANQQLPPPGHTTHHIVLPAVENKQKVKFDLPEEQHIETFTKPKMPPLEESQQIHVEDHTNQNFNA
jgi:hypothetical protein